MVEMSNAYPPVRLVAMKTHRTSARGGETMFSSILHRSEADALQSLNPTNSDDVSVTPLSGEES